MLHTTLYRQYFWTKTQSRPSYFLCLITVEYMFFKVVMCELAEVQHSTYHSIYSICKILHRFKNIRLLQCFPCICSSNSAQLHKFYFIFSTSADTRRAADTYLYTVIDVKLHLKNVYHTPYVYQYCDSKIVCKNNQHVEHRYKLLTQKRLYPNS